MTTEEKPKKFKIVTHGCRTNQYETQGYRDQLEALGYEAAQDGEEAAICIVNTCTVTESADASSRHSIRQLARENPGTQLVVTGCYAEAKPQVVQQLPGVTRVIPNKDKEQLIASIFPDEDVPEFAIKRFDAHTRAFVKVQDGCNSFCTYCVIPYVRGRSRSRTMADVVQEAETLVRNGYKEIVLTGINIGDFDGNRPEGERPDRLADLVRAVDAVPGLERLRVSSIDPDEVDEDLADAILNGRNTCHSMHVVLQAGSNVILKRMNRKYTRQIFLDTVERLRVASPDFTFTTDIIVGFPGETDFDFQETLAVMEAVKFAKVHMFPYSERPRTRAAQYPNKVAPETIKERKQAVLRQSEKHAFELRQQFVGRRMKILTESEDAERPDEINGHTENFLLVWVPRTGLASNQILEVDLVQNTPSGFIGRVIAQNQLQACCG